MMFDLNFSRGRRISPNRQVMRDHKIICRRASNFLGMYPPPVVKSGGMCYLSSPPAYNIWVKLLGLFSDTGFHLFISFVCLDLGTDRDNNIMVWGKIH